MCVFFFFKQKTAYEMRISDWSSDVCSSDLHRANPAPLHLEPATLHGQAARCPRPRQPAAAGFFRAAVGGGGHAAARGTPRRRGNQRRTAVNDRLILDIDRPPRKLGEFTAPDSISVDRKSA